jgi:hypothetical protein
MVEYHVDTCYLFQQRMNEETAFGGRRSDRYESRQMLIILGHDEAIMKQYLITNKHWPGPNGEKAISPKDEGLGIMISTFQALRIWIWHENKRGTTCRNQSLS